MVFLRRSARSAIVVSVGVLLCAVLLAIISVSASFILKTRSSSEAQPVVDRELLASVSKHAHPANNRDAFAQLQAMLPNVTQMHDQAVSPDATPFITIYENALSCTGKSVTANLKPFNGLYGVCVSAVNSTVFYECSIQTPGMASILWSIFFGPYCIETDLTVVLYAYNAPVDSSGCFQVTVLTPTRSAILAAQMACPLPKKSAPISSSSQSSLAGN